MTSTLADAVAETQELDRQKDKTARTLARELRCLELRIRGYSYHRIAKELHISPSTAFLRTKVATERLHDQVIAMADKYRSVQLTRYENMLEAVWEQANTPGARGQMHAMEMLIRVMERIDRVAGTEAPMRKIIQVVDEALLYAATQRLENEASAMEEVIARRERMKAVAIEAEVLTEEELPGGETEG